MNLKQILLVLLAALLLTACQEEKGELSFMVFGDPAK